MVGSAARMRVSSATSPSRRGTLKSTRTSARLPRTSASVTDRFGMVRRSVRTRDRRVRLLVFARLDALLTDEGDELGDAAGVRPLVVVPGQHLDEIVTEGHRRQAVDNGGARVAPKIGRHQWFLGVAENS